MTRRTQWPSSWVQMPEAKKKECVAFWVALCRGSEPQCVLDWAVLEMGERSRGRPKLRERTARQLLLTYQGQFGLVDISSFEQPDNLDALVAELTASPHVQQMWKTIKDEACARASAVQAQDLALSLEVCTRTLKETGCCRLHFHLCLRSDRKLHFRSLEEFKILGTLPHSTLGAVAKSRSRCSDWSPFYYCTGPKLGVVLQHSSKEAYVYFLVNADWIWHLVQSGKMAMKPAREELIKSAKNLARHLQNWDKLQCELTARSLQKQIAAKEVAFSQQRRPFRQLPEVTRWLQEHREPSERKRFLVLDGPSRLGKTQFAVGLVGAGRALEVNCASCTDPPLRKFDAQSHSLILFDEASVEMVLRNRRLFQAPNSGVTIGTSPTNMMAYDVYLNDTLLIVASNSWMVQLKSTPLPEANWILSNQVLVTVDAPLWLDVTQ